MERSKMLFPLKPCAGRSPGAGGVLTHLALIGFASLAVAGCAGLPSSGPNANAIVQAGKGPTPAYRLIDLLEATPAELSSPSTPTMSLAELSGPAAAEPADAIEVGDVLQITVFEIGAALFSSPPINATVASAPTANAEVLPPIPVRPDGNITVPYIGEMQAAGRSPADLSNAIEAGLSGKSQSPQVLVSIREDVGNTVILIGDVKSPGRRPLNYRREHLLDMIAIAGGPVNSKSDTLVRLTRGERSIETRLEDIHSGDGNDIALRPQDRIELTYRARTFTAFGAAGKVSEIPLQSSRVSLAEALARMGGPLDAQADSTGVFLFRRYPQDLMPRVYQLNMKDPRAYLASQNFEVRDKDVILVANARANAWYKAFSIVNAVVSPFVTAKYLGQ
jgi:polysaccharide export outer membrane protein